MMSQIRASRRSKSHSSGRGGNLHDTVTVAVEVVCLCGLRMRYSCVACILTSLGWLRMVQLRSVTGESRDFIHHPSLRMPEPHHFLPHFLQLLQKSLELP